MKKEIQLYTEIFGGFQANLHRYQRMLLCINKEVPIFQVLLGIITDELIT